MPPQAITISIPWMACSGQAVAKWTAQPDHVPHLEAAGGPGYAAGVADGMDDQAVGDSTSELIEMAASP